MSFLNDINVVSSLPVVVYDNGGKTVDRYTVLNIKTGEVFHMSKNPLSPQGVNSFAGIMGDAVTRHPADDGQVVPLRLLPFGVVAGIARRYETL